MKRSKIISFILFALITHQSHGAANVHPDLKRGLEALSNDSIDVKVACEEKTTLHRSYFANGANCSKFVQSDGRPGVLGRTIIEHISSMGSKAQFFRNDLNGISSICPKWNTLQKEIKANFWVWFIAAISRKETTCGAATVNKAATHGVAVGHLQLNQNKKDRSWRGGTSGKSCAATDIANEANNIKCGLEILNEQLKGKSGIYEGSGELFGRRANSYWQALRTKTGGKVIEMVKHFPHCH